MTSLALSVLLALVSAVCYAAGAILQEHVAATTPRLAAFRPAVPPRWAARSRRPGQPVPSHSPHSACS
ncbi:hypothetical protein ACWEWX_49640, partial [Streptomyces asiaticus]